MPELTEFLLARIAEDEQVATQSAGSGSRKILLRDPVSANTTRWTPARVLAECETKRRIVATHTKAHQSLSKAQEMDDSSTDAGLAIGLLKAVTATTEAVMRCLATVYADHPQFQPEWRP